MSKGMTLAVVTVWTLGFVAAGAAADELAAVQKKIETAWAAHKSMTAKITTHTRVEQAGQLVEGTGEGTFEFLRQGGKLMSRKELKGTLSQKMGEQEMVMHQQAQLIVDGQYAYAYSESVTEIMGNKMPTQRMASKSEIDGQTSGDPKEMFAELTKDHDLKLLPEESIDSHKVYVIQASPRTKNPASPTGDLLLYFDQDGGFIRKMVVQDNAGKPMHTVTYRDVKLDVDLDPARFVFKAPEGVEVIDQTSRKP